MKYLRLFEDKDIDFNDWEEIQDEEFDTDDLKVGDYVEISSLYDKYPTWSGSFHYEDAVNKKEPLKIVSIAEAPVEDKKRGIKKVVHFNRYYKNRNTDTFYVPIDVCGYVSIKENFNLDDWDDIQDEEIEEITIKLNGLSNSYNEYKKLCKIYNSDFDEVTKQNDYIEDCKFIRDHYISIIKSKTNRKDIIDTYNKISDELKDDKYKKSTAIILFELTAFTRRLLKNINESIDIDWEDIEDEEFEVTNKRGSMVSDKGEYMFNEEIEFVILMEDRYISSNDILLSHDGKNIYPNYITDDPTEVNMIVNSSKSSLLPGYNFKKTLIMLDKNDWNQINVGDLLYVNNENKI